MQEKREQVYEDAEQPNPSEKKMDNEEVSPSEKKLVNEEPNSSQLQPLQ